MSVAILEAGGPLVEMAANRQGSDQQYDIGVDLTLIIHWKTPAKNNNEVIEREEKQKMLNYKAQLFAHELVLKFNNDGV